jgi:2-polyprenyl-3-methyl-5-hydroxy-6-metoxy-1,4-benzoquinol methylase
MTGLPRSSAAFVTAAPVFTDNDREHPACALCEQRETRLLVVRKGFRVVRCTSCGLVYVSPRPRQQGQIDALYTNRTYSERQVSHVASAGRMREARWRLARVERHAPERGRLLDVGCSAGSFLLAARARGWQVRGIDVSPDAVEHAATAHALDVRVATLEDAAFPPKTFDVITLFECIEHLLHPARALQAAHGLLRDGGLLVITTPNVGGFVPRITYQILGRTIGAWEHPTPPHHLYQFSRRTLEALLRKSGFTVVSSRTRPMGLRFTVKQMQSAIIEALRRRMPVSLTSTQPALDAESWPPAASPSHNSLRRQTAALARKTARRAVAAACWMLGLTLYALPLHHLGAGDSMIVVARK